MDTVSTSETLVQAKISDSVLYTYRYLRGGTVVMVVMLGVAVLDESRAAHSCWLPSISAYCYTTAHNVFVAALCAIGVLLIVYRPAIDTEDGLLNLAGIMAFVVAFVPTSPPHPGSCGVDGSVLKSHPAIDDNVVALAAALIVARVGFVLLRRWKRTSTPKRSVGGWLMSALVWVVVGIGAVGYLRFRDPFYEHAHQAAAVAMFGAIIATVIVSAIAAARHDPTLARHKRRYFWSYVLLATVMIGTVAAVLATHSLLDDWAYWVISLEALLIVEFAVYWAIQTMELWDVRSTVDLFPPHLRDDALHDSAGGTPRELVDEVRDLRNYPVERRVLRAL